VLYLINKEGGGRGGTSLRILLSKCFIVWKGMGKDVVYLDLVVEV